MNLWRIAIKTILVALALYLLLYGIFKTAAVVNYPQAVPQLPLEITAAGDTIFQKNELVVTRIERHKPSLLETHLNLNICHTGTGRLNLGYILIDSLQIIAINRGRCLSTYCSPYQNKGFSLNSLDLQGVDEKPGGDCKNVKFTILTSNDSLDFSKPLFQACVYFYGPSPLDPYHCYPAKLFEGIIVDGKLQTFYRPDKMGIFSSINMVIILAFIVYSLVYEIKKRKANTKAAGD